MVSNCDDFKEVFRLVFSEVECENHYKKLSSDFEMMSGKGTVK